MGNCKDCKHWGDEDIVDEYERHLCMDETPAPEIRKCTSPKILYKFSDSGMYETDDVDDDRMKYAYPHEGGAMIWDGSGYHAGWGTTATFGCHCFEAKQNVGVDGVRDPDAPCDVFVSGVEGVEGGCMGDGHYICSECVLHDKQEGEDDDN